MQSTQTPHCSQCTKKVKWQAANQVGVPNLYLHKYHLYHSRCTSSIRNQLTRNRHLKDSPQGLQVHNYATLGMKLQNYSFWSMLPDLRHLKSTWWRQPPFPVPCGLENFWWRANVPGRTPKLQADSEYNVELRDGQEVLNIGGNHCQQEGCLTRFLANCVQLPLCPWHPPQDTNKDRLPLSVSHFICTKDPSTSILELVGQFAEGPIDGIIQVFHRAYL